MKDRNSIHGQVDYFFESLRIHRKALEFIKEHKLWRGFRRAGWAWKISVIAGILVSLRFLAMIFDWLGYVRDSDEGVTVVTGAMSLFEGMTDFGKELTHSSGLRYLALFFMEVLIFHFAVKTLNILDQKDYVPSFKDFVRAEIRMFKVIVRSWLFELLLAGLISLFLGMIGLGFAKIVFIFFVQCYFLGFAYIDNFNEQYGMKINDSAKVIRKYSGAAIGIGIINYILFLIPILGPIIAPLVGAVSSSLFMFEHSRPESERMAFELV